MRIFRQRLKYGNKPTVLNGIRFASKKEAHRYCELIVLEKQGQIKDLKLQPRFELQPKFEKEGIKYRNIEYIADFSYQDNKSKKSMVEDVKGFRNNIFLLKQKLFEYRYKNLTLRLI